VPPGLPTLKEHMSKDNLIVDDSAIMRRGLRTYFDLRPGFEVCGEAVDGAEAIQKAVVLKPDLIILDFSMPGMNGLQVAAILQQIMPTVPIILFTLHKDAISGDEAHNAGIASVVVKGGQSATLFEEAQRLVSIV
jgi:two-component system response regulator NreC